MWLGGRKAVMRITQSVKLELGLSLGKAYL